MSTPNPTHIIAGHHVRWWSKTQGHSYAWCWCGEEFASVEIHAEHVVSKLTDAGYSIERRDALARAMYLNQARHHVHPDDSMSPEQSWDEGFFPRKSLWLDQADRILAAVAEGDTNV